MTDQLIMTTAQRVNLCELIEKDGFPNQPAIDLLQSLPMVDGEPAVTPPFGSKRNAALALYKPPFKFEHGYIFDAEHHMVAADDDVESHVAARVRGWGRIGYMPDAAQLQDEVGKVIADALTAYWTPSPQALTPITAADVTDEMRNSYVSAHQNIGSPMLSEQIAAAYNAVIKNRSEAK